ncbi:MAG TPA: ion channel [Anaerolineae bacterium]|nr:ion channel [Anaerolineae bacterium]
MFFYLTHIIKKIKRVSQAIRKSSLAIASAPIIALIFLGTLGYAWIEGWSLLDALYATIITMTTVGYGDLSPQTVTGRVFSIFFTVTAVGFAGYAISTLAAIVIDHELNRKERAIENRRMNAIKNLKDHYIICGATDLSHRVTSQLYRRGEPFIWLAEDEETLKQSLLWINEEYLSSWIAQFEYQTEEVHQAKEELMSLAELADHMNVPYLIHDDITDEQLLLRSGLARARGLIATADTDSKNIAIILSVRDMAPKLKNNNIRIVSAAIDNANARRLYLAGAHKVTVPSFVGGLQAAYQLLNPVVGDFWQHMLLPNDESKHFIDIHLDKFPQFVGMTPQKLKEDHDQLVLAIQRDGKFIYGPSLQEKFLANDVLIVLGEVIN